jgi:CheY-like chemotaxis protein
MESLGTLAGGIAHDLNNVLAPILMSTELLAQGETDPRRLQLLDALVTSTNRGADMVRQVLAFARGVSGDRVEVDPADLLGGVLAIVRETFPRNIVIDCQLDQPLATLRADPTQLHQVLMNLLVNARDAMPDGGRIRCSARMVAIDAQYASVTMGLEAGDHVLIEVTDTGHGMSGDVIDRIFEPFFTTKEIGVGTGLGLSTSLAIVDSHGGHLGVYSEPGQGTTFRIHLPVGRATTTEDHDADLPHDAPCGRGETVLVVDDEPTILEVTQRGLVEAGYRVLAAPDGAEAVALFAQDPDAVDLVLTDMMMPVMDGAATVHALRTLRPDLRVIATSGLDASDHEGRTAAVGVDRVLTKPFSTATLLHAVRSVLDAEDR